MTFTPRSLLAPASTGRGISNLISWYDTRYRRDWEPFRQMLNHRVGNAKPKKISWRAARRCSRSTRSVKPLLIGQGANDPRVPQAEADQMVEALRSRGIPVDDLLFEDEGHGFARPENRLTYYRAAEQFLAGVLGGRTEG